LLIDFLLLSIIFLVFILYTFIYKKDYKRVTFLYSFSLITIFYTPSLYFFFGGEAYRFFTDKSLIDFFHIGTITIFIYLVLSWFIDSLNLKQSTVMIKNSLLVKIYFLIIIIPILLYYIVYFKSFPLVNLLLNGELIDRPDLTGAIPHFYTISTVVSIIIPSIYFFYFREIKSKYMHLLINIIMIFLFIASGNKGFLAYYFIFVWLYIFNGKVDIKLILMFFFLMLVYAITKGILSVNPELFSYMMNSPFRRFFVSQGTGFIHRIDMVNEGFDFLHNSNPRGLKFDVFAHMYNTTSIVGSAPTFYTADFYAKYGEWVSFVIFTIISSIILYISKLFHIMNTNRKLFFYWNIYAIIFFIVMAEINFTNTIRIIVGIANIYIVILISKIVIKEKYAKQHSLNNNPIIQK